MEDKLWDVTSSETSIMSEDGTNESFGEEILFEENIKLEEGFNYTLFVSYVELYNEKLYDLLSDHRQPLTLKDENGKFIIKELQERPIANEQEGLQLLEAASRNRQVASTNLNHDSSRSHTIVTFKLVKFPKSAKILVKLIFTNNFLHFSHFTA